MKKRVFIIVASALVISQMALSETMADTLALPQIESEEKQRGGELTQAHLGETAFVLRKKELLLGLRKSAYGIFNWFSLETIPLHDLLGSWNIFGKLKLFTLGPITVAGRGGIFYITRIEQLPEVEQSSLYRHYLGGTVSTELNESVLYHLNMNSSGLFGAAQDPQWLQKKKSFNIENDLEYKVNERRSVIGAIGYQVSAKKILLGGSHIWKWSTFHLQLGLTFETGFLREPVTLSMLPVFDLGIRF